MNFGLQFILTSAFVALTVAGLIYTLVAGWLMRTRRVSQPPVAAGMPGVTILKPLCLGEAGLDDNLRSFFEQDYSSQIQIIFGVQSRSDPAMQIANRLCEEHPGHDVACIIDPSVTGPNPKISNLVNMIGHAKNEVLILSDSDIRVPRNYVRTIVAELQKPNVGAVTCVYTGKPLGGLWATLAAMHIDYGFLPGVVFGTSMGLTAPCFGSTIALRRDTLSEIGGFQAVLRHLADDFELGRAIRAKGYRIELSSIAVIHICAEKQLGEVVRHELRWAKTVRLLNPLGHIGSIVTHVFPLSLIAAAFSAFAISGLGLVCAALTARLWLAWRVRSVLGTRAGPLWLVPARDMLSFLVFLASLFGNSVHWRGTRYLTGADGLLAQR